ncbi:MAG: NADP-dependent malic enzyme [Peptostreptococcaceae bacterium]|nr:NADP-dependent malic enzyme [Peptostreptococcaceae bacterium]
MPSKTKALKKHLEWRGKLEVVSKAEIETMEDLAIAYTPGVAEPCLEIEMDEMLAYEYTGKGNLVAVITDGTAVLGLGDIGPSASMPVMEGKCALFKRFAGINAIPICIDSKDTEEIINTVKLISKSFGGINLEDISAPRCFEIERRLIEECDVPVFHDDQHGTAIITSAGVLNAIRYTGRKKGTLNIVINGGGAAGLSIAKLFVKMGFGDVIVCDINGAIYEGSEFNNSEQEKVAKITNKDSRKGNLAEVMKNADVFVGVSKPNLVNEEMIKSMAKDPIVFSMANPIPEIMPDIAKKAGACIVGTGRSDYPNQVNNVLAFPGIFKGLLSVKATRVTDSMKVAAAEALAYVITDDELSDIYILPDVFNEKVVEVVAKAVADKAIELDLIRK